MASRSSTPSHTPGPWVVDVERTKGRRGKKGLPTMLMVVAEKGGMPGLIVNQPPLVEPRDVANAALIAAAPDLLEALTRIVHLNDEMPEEHPARLSHGEYMQACAAIKKARGT